MRACWAPVSVEPLGKTVPVVLSLSVCTPPGGMGFEPLHAVLNCRSATAESPPISCSREQPYLKQVDRCFHFSALFSRPAFVGVRGGGGVGGCIPSHSCKYNWRVGGVGWGGEESWG
jgi:hypothetical protein